MSYPFTVAPYEALNLLGVMHADSQTGEQNSGWFSLAQLHGVWIVVSVGDIAGGGTLDIDIEQATDTAGAGIKNVAGKSIAQLTQAGGDSDDPLSIWVRAEELDVANDFDAIQVEVTGAVAAAEYSVMIFGVPARYTPVSVTNWTEVVD